MKKILWALIGIVLIALTYYLVIRPFEFEANFKAKTLPGDLIETIRIWNRSLDNAKVVEVDSFATLTQAIVWNNKSYVYRWHFDAISDSLTKVSVQISEPNRSILNKLLIPFTDQDIERDADDIVRGFYDILKKHLEITKVKIIGEAEVDSSFCVCRSIETSQIEKANGMMRDYSLLTSFISEFGLKSDGLPMVRVGAWDHNLGILKFDFCFPIIPTDSLPLVREITYKRFDKEKALKAEYNGNYITSDRAWYELIQYAEKNGYRINGLPVERFHNNPNLGLNESQWKADVYLPIND
jgi:effector-binding domain-containing protein